MGSNFVAVQRQLEFPICEPDVIIEHPHHKECSRKITDAQLRKLRCLDRDGAAKELAAAKAGMDPKTARKYRRLGKLPSEVKIMDRGVPLASRRAGGGGLPRSSAGVMG